MAYDRKARMAMTAGLNARDRRRLNAQALKAQEDFETAQDARAAAFADLWTKGLSRAQIEIISGEGPTAVRQMLQSQGLDVDSK